MPDAPTTIVLLRHGQSFGNIIDSQLIKNTIPEYSKKFLLKGDAEWPLTELGHQQAYRAGLVLRERFPDGFDHIFCSPFVRSQQTLNNLEIGSGIFEPLLQEQSWGQLNGPEILERIAERQTFEKEYQYNVDLRPLDGETIREVYARVSSFWQQQRDNLHGKTTLIVSHWTPLFLSRLVLNEIPLEEFSSAYCLPRPILNCQMDIYCTHSPLKNAAKGWWNCSLCMESLVCESYPWQRLHDSSFLL